MKKQENINVTYIESEFAADKKLWGEAPKLDVVCKLNFNSPDLIYPVKVFFTTKSGIMYSEDEPKTGKVRRFWEELDYGSKVEIICQKSNGKGYVPYNHSIKEHFGGIGIWKP